MTDDEKPIIHKASTTLQDKAGTGKIGEDKIARSEAVGGNLQDNFPVIGGRKLKELKDMLIEGHRVPNPANVQFLKEDITEEVMNIKSSAEMFNYESVGRLSRLMLGFLEARKALDTDIMEILEGYYDGAKHCLDNKYSGDEGLGLSADIYEELEDACERYVAKHGE